MIDRSDITMIDKRDITTQTCIAHRAQWQTHHRRGCAENSLLQGAAHVNIIP